MLIAIQFSFNDSRSLTVWHGFTTKWYFADPIDSVWHNADLPRRAQPEHEAGRRSTC